MEKKNHTASADKRELIDRAIEQGERQALEKAAQSERKITDVRGLQKDEVKTLLQQQTEAHTAPTEHAKTPDAGAEFKRLMEEADDEVDAMSDEREAQTAVVKDAKVGNLGGSTVGLQKDGTKEIWLDQRVIGTKFGTKVAKHEYQHRLQEGGDARFKLPPTGNPEIDKHRDGIRRLMFREKDSMDAEGGIHANTSGKYIEDYWDPVQAIQKELNKRGENGDELARNAAMTQEGFQVLHRTLVASVMAQPNPQKKDGQMPEWKPEYALSNN